MNEQEHGGLSIRGDDPLVRFLHRVIRAAVKLLAVLMALVIMWGVADVVWVVYQRLLQPPFLLLKIGDILATFGAFLAVLIAIEIFLNITMYLREDIIHVRLVVATALMAISRKVIVFDFKEVTFQYVLATGAVVLGLGVTYWLVSQRPENECVVLPVAKSQIQKTED